MEWMDLIGQFDPTTEREQADKTQFMSLSNLPWNPLERSEGFGHVTASALVLNPSHKKVLLVYHNQYGAWSWPGGHCDGNPDLFEVARQEVEEETGVVVSELLYPGIATLDILPVPGHIKNGVYRSTHLHFSVGFLMEADEDQLLKPKWDENAGVKWIARNDLSTVVAEGHMLAIYEKMLRRLS